MSFIEDIFGPIGTPYGVEPPSSIRHGTDGDDYIYGPNNSLSADTIYGHSGHDTIKGREGNDIIDGGPGNDLIIGGPGFDDLTGGLGFDEFRFASGDSGLRYEYADIIRDWDVKSDTINFSGFTGMVETYHEEFFRSDGLNFEGAYNLARGFAERDIGSPGLDGSKIIAAFYTDGHDGYLFADNNLNGTVDMGVELRGVTSLDQFNWSDMVY